MEKKMIELKKDSIVYVLCPAYLKTGGPELLHQLVYSLNKNKIEAYITYIDIKENDKNYTNQDFKKYITTYKLFDEIEDDSKNLVVIPETIVELINEIKNAKKAIWWLSVDNYEVCYLFKKCKQTFGFLYAFKRIIRNTIKNIHKKDIFKADFHFCQSHYAIDYLAKKGIKNSIYLSDYLNDVYLTTKVDYSKKEDIVLYNPKKGFEFTKLIINQSKDLNWVPIEKLTTEQVRELLLKSKVYIDFGNHPGKDRFPRETAICGCCVITGKRGAANYYNDVPINDEFKFQDDEKNVDDIIKKIRNCIDNYDKENIKFNNYRKIILNEKKKFEDDVKKIFIIK